MLLLPLHGAFIVIFFVIVLVKLFALIDAATRPEAAYVNAGKQTKKFWLLVLVLALASTFVGFFSIIGLVAALVYIVDVRAAIVRT